MANKIQLNALGNMEYARREALNSLRTNLMFCGENIKTIMFTSCNPDEGKSTVSFDLARSVADHNQKVLFIDCDMRKSVMVNRYRIKGYDAQQKGLTHFLSGQAKLDEVVCETNVPGLSMIMTGPLSPNPTELLAGDKMKNALEELKEQFDLILIDTPPLGMVIDAAILAPACDGTILVVASNHTSRRQAVKVKKQLEMTGCRMLGAVMNKAGLDSNGYYYNGYYKKGYYQYYGE